MLKILSLLVSFLSELVFDYKESKDFKSYKFNTRKFMVLVLIVTSLLLNFLLIYRIGVLATKVNDMSKTVKAYEKLQEEVKLKEEKKLPGVKESPKK